MMILATGSAAMAGRTLSPVQSTNSRGGSPRKVIRRDKSLPSKERSVRLSVGRAGRFAAVGEGAVLLPWEAVSDSEATQSSTAFTVVLPPYMAQALPLLELGRGSRDTSGGPFVQRTQAANLAMYGPAVIVL